MELEVAVNGVGRAGGRFEAPEEYTGHEALDPEVARSGA